MTCLYSPLAPQFKSCNSLIRRNEMIRTHIRRNATTCAQTLMICLFTLIAISAVAQDETVPKIDIFAGYQWLNANGDVPVPGTSNPVQGLTLKGIPKGFGVAGAYNFTRYLALEADYGGNWKDSFSFNTFSIGPRVMLRTDAANFFVHTLVSDNLLNMPTFGRNNGIGAILGGGIDVMPWKHFGFRLFEADYQWARHNFGSDGVPSQQPDLRRSTFEGLRLRSGVIMAFGGEPAVPPTAACSAQPSEVMVGEPVTVTATPSNFNPKHALSYDWSSNAGKVSGKDTTATIDTNGIAGGNYTATAKITDAKVKNNGMASCSASFTVKEPPKNPPTMNCTANPSSAQAGGAISVICTCTSPDSVPVTVASWSATAGSVSGNASTATLDTTGAAPGQITVSAVCTDTRGLNTSANTMVTVETPPPPAGPTVQELEVRLALHSIYFPTAQPTPQKPQVGLLQSQQQTLTALASDFQLYLQHKPDAHLILEGHADPRGSAPYNQALSERRVDLTRSFLIDHGVPAGSIETKAYGLQKNMTAAQVKEAVEQNPQVTPEQRQRLLKNMRTILLASNRRVDVTLSTTGQTSVRQYPFNAADSLTLLEQKQTAKSKPAAKKMKKKQ
jgi:outer membrane protein OmpA-like peptidoglycan-associated protein